jgi:hypothetical protein
MENKSICGADFDLTDDENILSIKTPIDRVNGPYIVVEKDMQSRTVIVALDFDGIPCLGRHSFTDDSDKPLYRGHPSWEIISEKEDIIKIISAQDERIRVIIEDFLSNDESKLTGKELSIICSIKRICTYHAIDEQKTIDLCYTCYNKIKKEANAENREKQNRKIKEKLEEIKRKFNSPTTIFSKSEVAQEIGNIF